ncbi:hypothetical protein ACWEKT_37945 [Nocardia takedensis]
MTDREPEPIFVDGWTYYPRTPVARQAAVAPPPPKKRTGLVVGVLAAVAVLAIAAACTTVVLVRRADTAARAAENSAQIETALRRYLQITSAEDPAYRDVACAEFRARYVGSACTSPRGVTKCELERTG